MREVCGRIETDVQRILDGLSKNRGQAISGYARFLLILSRSFSLISR